jgi:hypothetical protein
MGAALRIPLGAPGIYLLPDEPLRELAGVRMDVAAFVGVAPRGPARVPLVDETWPDDRPCVEPDRPRRRTAAFPVESFDEYRRLYGGFEGPGLLPYAVASFFEQGGRRAWIARLVHDYGNPADNNQPRVASGTLAGVTTTAGPLGLRARSEGSWGNRLSASIRFTVTPLGLDDATAATLTLAPGAVAPPGTLLQLTLPGGGRVFRFISEVRVERLPTQPGSLRLAVLDSPLSTVPNAADVWEGVLTLDDGDGRLEVHERLGLARGHPRWMALVLCYESDLVYPDAAWVDAFVTPQDDERGEPFQGGRDAYEDITPEDFFDSRWTLGDDQPGDGVHCVANLSELSLLVVPDLYSPFPLAGAEPIVEPASLAGPDFERCVNLPPPPEQQTAAPDLQGLRLDPRIPGELAQIADLQARLVEFAALLRSFVVLLDVPPGLNQSRILRWRAPLDSAYAAAYHPWLRVARDDDRRGGLIRVPPAAVAAGLIAASEITFGVPRGPANLLAAGVVSLDDHVSPPRHDELHPQGINVFLPERDGLRLTGARTLSRDPQWRQLSVRRLITMIARTLEQQTQWIVFEPNTPALRADVRKLLQSFLRRLFLAGAFRGASEEEAFFVECDEALNPPRVVDLGQLIARVGVAPAEPLEFIVLRLTRGSDGTLAVEE